MHAGEACFRQQGAHLAQRIAFTFRDAHQQRGVQRGWQGTCFFRVEMHVMQNQQASRWKGIKGVLEELFHFREVPIMQDVREEMDVEARG